MRTMAALTFSIATAFAMTAHAADTAASGATLTKQEAKDLKQQSDAQYKARKKAADAVEDLNKADCKSEFTGGVKGACKDSADAQNKQDKSRAKMIHEAEKQDIKSQSKGSK